MIIVLQVAGVVAVLVGLVTIGVGIPVKEFSFGNTLILAGTVGLCTGMILLGLSVVAGELRSVARRLAAPRPAGEPRAKAAALPAFPAAQTQGDNGPVFTRDQPPPVSSQTEPTAPPWHEDAASRARLDAPLEVEQAQAAPAPPVKPRRNLLFASSVRKDRERPPARPGEPAAGDLRTPPPVAPNAAEAGEVPPASFEDAWPKPDRARSPEVPPQRRASRLAPAESTVSVAAERSPPPAPPAAPPSAPADPTPTVTVLKSGVVDGMAYSLYSDGSIEAQMPEGMMRFASIDELRAHLDQRP
jgi:hypothetical protein